MDEKRRRQILDEIAKVNREVDDLARDAREKREKDQQKNGQTKPWTGSQLLD